LKTHRIWKKWVGRGLLGVLGLGAVAVGVAYWQIKRSSGWILTGGVRRSYLLYVPKSYRPGKAAPLVISIHGYAEWPGHQAQISRWDKLAEEYGFIVVYPAGIRFPMRWRTHGAAGTIADPLIDVTFISDLIDRLEREYSIDPRRIYANGLSNGGGMSFLLSCKLSERIAAIGSVSGAYLTPWEECDRSRPMPLIAFHGTADPVVPYWGGPSRSFKLPFPAVPDWMADYARHNGCMGQPVGLPRVGTVSGIQYRGSGPDADVVFYTIAGGGHAWPGGPPLPRWLVGKTNQDVDATRLMWDFFQVHPIKK
jgi:polyhydroxybutyrate depolymerase